MSTPPRPLVPDLAPQDSATPQDPTGEQLDIMRHALGTNYTPRHERNHYLARLEDGSTLTAIKDLVARGLMSPRSKINDGQDQYFVVTPEGQALVARLTPPPPRLTRSQKRYRGYLRSGAADCMTFGEYLRQTKGAHP